MVWLLQLTNLQCPCLGLTSNELRELLFSCIKGAIREASQFLPPMERHLPGIFYLPCDCPPTAHTAPLGWNLPWNPETLKPGQRKRWGSGFCRAQRQSVTSNLCIDHSSSLLSHLPFVPHKPFTPSPSSFLLSVPTSLWGLGFAHRHLSNGCIWTSYKKEER